MNGKMRLLFREGMQYIQQSMAYRTSLVPAPLEAALFLTRRCNSRCTMCNFWKYPEKNEELSTEQVLDILDTLAEMGVVILSLSAEGEITLRKDLSQIIQRAHQLGFLYSINSNFLNISDEIIALFSQYPPYQVTVGLDTVDSKKYASIRGIENGVNRVLSSIEKLQKTGYTNIVLGTVVLSDNVDDLAELTKYVVEKGLRGIRFTAFQPSGFGMKWSEQDLKRYTDPLFQKKLSEAISTLITMKKSGAPIINSIPYLTSIPQTFMNPGFFPVTCRTPTRRIHIYSNGDVSLCQIMAQNGIVGNIKNKSLKTLWHSESAKKIRELVKKKKCGGCWLSCYQETNLRFSVQKGPLLIMDALIRFFRL